MSRRRAFTWKKALLALLVIIGVWALLTGYSICRMVIVVIPHSYAAWTTGDLLVEYMDTHNGGWPQNWEDLENARDSLIRKGRNIYYDFNKLPAIVKIDWNVNSTTLAKDALVGGESAVRVVTQLDGSRLEAQWGRDTEPNRKVGRYLIKKHSPPETVPSPTAAPPNTTNESK